MEIGDGNELLAISLKNESDFKYWNVYYTWSLSNKINNNKFKKGNS